MPRPKIYATDAERQAADRQRRAAKQDATLGRLYALERAVWAAADAGDPVADKVKSASLDGMLDALIKHFEGQAAPEAPPIA